MELGLQGARCIITGASDGIGAATALALARATDLIASVPERHTGNLRDGLHSFALPVPVPQIVDTERGRMQ